MSLILGSMHRAISSTISNILSNKSAQNVMARNIHYMCNRQYLNHMQSSPDCNTSTLLQPVLPIYNSVCGLKSKGKLQLRCKNCYFVARKERWFVMCKTHPRHKQVQIKQKEYKTWIITSASQSKVREW